jgi:hypothetical protein
LANTETPLSEHDATASHQPPQNGRCLPLGTEVWVRNSNRDERHPMSDRILVDAPNLMRLSEEFRMAATELRREVNRFQATSWRPDGYGSLQVAHTAAEEHQSTRESMVGHLQHMASELDATADELTRYAHSQLRADQAAAEIARGLGRPR